MSKQILNKSDYNKQQQVNLLYPNEEYIFSDKNINKADLHRFHYVYDLHQNLRGKMLDIGCNDGFFMRAFPWLFDSFTGVDLYSITQYSKYQYWLHRSYYSKKGLIKYKKGIFEEMVNIGKYDFVFAGEIIEHVLDVNKFLQALRRSLKPGAHWCLTTPNNIGRSQPEHNRQFNKSSLTKTLRKYFKNVQVEVLESPGDSWPFLIAYGISNAKQ